MDRENFTHIHKRKKAIYSYAILAVHPQYQTTTLFKLTTGQQNNTPGTQIKEIRLTWRPFFEGVFYTNGYSKTPINILAS